MSRSGLTCGKEVEPVLKILVIIEFVLSICVCLVYIVVAIVTALDPSPSVLLKQFLTYNGFDLENEDKFNDIVYVIILATVIYLCIKTPVFFLFTDGMKKKSYTKCRQWFIICVKLEIFFAMALYFWSSFLWAVWISHAPFYFYLLLIDFLYLRGLKYEVSGGTENDKPETNEFL